MSWDDKYWCDLNAVSGQMFGVSPLTQNLWDLGRSLDVMQAMAEVDGNRIGAAGFSYGGTCTLFLAAIDDRVRAAVVSGYLASWAEAHKMPANMCGSQVLPGMLGRLEQGDLASLVSPRSLFIESSREDYLFPVQAAADEVAHLQRLGGVVEHHIHDGEHHWDGSGVLDFFTREL
jgi:dienelactone hydrolase